MDAADGLFCHECFSTESVMYRNALYLVPSLVDIEKGLRAFSDISNKEPEKDRARLVYYFMSQTKSGLKISLMILPRCASDSRKGNGI